MGSSASVPGEKATVEAKNIKSTGQAKAPSIPNSASGSKQSIRSRKGNGLQGEAIISLLRLYLIIKYFSRE